MIRWLRAFVTALTRIADSLASIDATLADIADLYYRDAGLTRHAVPLPAEADEDVPPARLYASDAASYDYEQRQRDERVEVSHG